MSVSKRIFVAITCLLISFSSVQANAEPKPWIFSWWSSHWDDLDFNPYLEGAPHTHTSQWDHTGWTPEDWINRTGGEELSTVRRFYKVGIIKDQYMDGEIPVLVVGQPFFQLGGQDKNRVMDLVDHVYGITQTAHGKGIFKICDGDEEIGIYTKYGAHFL